MLCVGFLSAARLSLQYLIGSAVENWNIFKMLTFSKVEVRQELDVPDPTEIDLRPVIPFAQEKVPAKRADNFLGESN